jgi:uncharacterized protein YozE (UPF0346 family)
MLVQEYVKDFNKLSSETKFLSSGNEVTLKNKLLLIQSDISNIKSCSPFEIATFYSNIYNLLNQCSDKTSQLISSCLEVLHISVNTRSREIKKTVTQDINFLPTILKLLIFESENDDDRLLRILAILKELIVADNDLDEHNTRCLITTICDRITNTNNENVLKLSLSVLAALGMHQSAKHMVRRSVKSAEVQKKIDKADQLIEMKFYVVINGEFLEKDFPHLIILSLRSIKEGIAICDTDPIVHSLDVLKHLERMQMSEHSKVSDNEQVIGMITELNSKLIEFHLSCNESNNCATEEFFDLILYYYSLLLSFDHELVLCFKEFAEEIYARDKFPRSSSAIAFLSTYIQRGGTFTDEEKIVESMVEHFLNLADEDSKYSYEQVGFNIFINT